MKLSFSTKGWHGYSFDDFCKIAFDFGYEGIELHNINGEIFTAVDGAFHDYATSKTKQKLHSLSLTVPCIDALCNIALGNTAENKEEILRCIEIASNLRIPFIRLKTDDSENCVAIYENVTELIGELIDVAESSNVVLLIETLGAFSDTKELRQLFERFASDNLAALWNTASTLISGEDAASVIKNLGKYVQHVHLTDARLDNGIISACILGDGDVDVDEVMLALKSVNYNEFISLYWDTSYAPELDDIEIILSQFADYVKKYGDTSRRKTTFYYNKTRTGKFIWKKDLIIDETFPQILERTANEFPDQYAFKYTTLDYTRTYDEFRCDVNEFARALIALGVKKGSHVAVWASNVPQWYIAFWATVTIGAVLVTVNTAYKIGEVEYLLKQSDTHTLIMTEGAKDTNYGKIISELCPELESLEKGKSLHASRLPFLRNVITVGYKLTGALSWDDAVALANKVPIDEVYRMSSNVNKDDVANMQYTSGTTGFPKGVMLTHHNIVNNGKCIGDRMDLSTEDRMMVQVPMFHCFGMVLAMTASMTHAATLLPLPYFSPKSALSCINNEHITAFHGVPTMFIAMLEHPDFEKTDFSFIRTGIMAGSPCPIATMQDVVNKMNMREITIVYGQTEASPGCTMSSTDDPIEVRVGTVGRPLPEIECKIINPETGKDCPDNVTGEFVARGYNIMKGYYKMPKATKETIDADGWLHTGDLAERTPEGNYRITGRLKDMIIRGGENIYPKEIEEFIYTYPKVSDVQVIGVPDEQYGEEVMACIIPKEGETITEAEIKEFLSSRIARHKVPKYIKFTDSFPMNAAGKILKYKMREDAIEEYSLKKAESVVTA